jgi:succinoglycan biosynthesis transport protein ExoP
MELARIWDIILRRRSLIIQAALVAGLAAFIASYIAVPSYDGYSKILLLQAKKGVIDIGAVGSELASMIKTSADVDVNKVMAASRPYVDRVVYRLQLRDDEGNLIRADQPEVETIKTRFFPQASVNVTQYRDTDILQIRGTSTDAEEAMMMANTLAEIMVDQNREMMRAEYRSAREFLQNQLTKVKEAYNKALFDLTDFMKKEKTLDLKTETKLVAEKMAELLTQKENNIIDLAEARAELNQLKKELARQDPDFVGASTLKESPQIEILKKRLTQLRLDFSEATFELTERHPRVLSLGEQIRMAEGALKREIEVYRSSAPELVALETRIVALEAHLKGVNAVIEKYLGDLGGLPDKTLKRESLGMELNVTQGTYKSLLDSLYQMGMAEATTLSEIKIIERAVKPGSPESPNKTLNTSLGCFVGLVFGLAIAFLMEYAADTVRTTDDVKEFKPIALIGTVPGFDAERPPLISERDPNDPLCESYRNIRNYLKMNESPVKTLLISSPGPGEGKSTTVVNLGISVCREGKKVAIVDMDLRRASLHTYFDLPNDRGVADLLQGKTSLDEALQPTRLEGLSVIPSGPPFPDAGELIESEQMGPLISELKNRFDVVLLDSAPVLIKSDVLVLARYVDGSIIVLESTKTTRRAVHEVLDVLAKAGIRPLGLVLNRFSIKKGKHFYQHRYYGHYAGELSTDRGSA